MVEKVIEILCEVKNDSNLKATLNGNSDIISEVGLDSLQMITFVLRLEDEFNIEMDFDMLDMEHLKKIASVCEVIEKAVAAENGPVAENDPVAG